MDFIPSRIGALIMLRFSVIAPANKRRKDDIGAENLPVTGRTLAIPDLHISGVLHVM